MSNIVVLDGVSVPYIQDTESKKWSSTVGHAWESDNTFVQKFAVEADKKIKNKPKNHGSVIYPPKKNSLVHLLQQHIEPKEKVDFHSFVKNVQKNNNISLETSRSQSKLVLIFLKYKKEITGKTNSDITSVENLLVMLLKDKSALRFEDNGSPEGTDIIDFDDVMQAAVININDLSNSMLSNTNVDVSFINGVGGTTNYFINFFDAENVVKNKDSVSNILQALIDFSAKHKLNRSQRESCDQSIKLLLEKNERNKFVTKIEEVSTVIFSALRKYTDLNIKQNTFVSYVQEYDYKINHEFNVGKNDRDKLEFITMETDVGHLKIKKSLFNNGDVEFNVNSNELTIKTKITDLDTINDLKMLQKND